jgi:UDP-glucose 4-epimerase
VKYFITGGAGFIGSNLVDRLVSLGEEVTIYDNLSLGRKEFISHHIGKKGFRFIDADLLDFNKLKESMKDHDVVFHLAANSDIDSGRRYSDIDLKQGTIVTYNVLEAMRLNNIKKIIFSSTSTIYGEPTIIPTPEDYGPLFPISLYGASKLACEGLISAFCHNYDINSFICRFANIVGRRGTHGVMVDFIKKIKMNPKELEILGDGQQKKSFLHVDEVIDAMLFLINNCKEELTVCNLGSGDQINIMEVARIVAEAMGTQDIEFKCTGGKRGWRGDVPMMNLKIDKINKLGWKAKYNSEEAVKRAVNELINVIK